MLTLYAIEGAPAALSTGLPKECRWCRDLKPRTAQYWHRDVRSPDGFQNPCKDCRNNAEAQRLAQKRGTSMRTMTEYSARPIHSVKVNGPNGYENSWSSTKPDAEKALLYVVDYYKWKVGAGAAPAGEYRFSVVGTNTATTVNLRRAKR